MAATLQELHLRILKGNKGMRKKRISTSMGIAITILIAGFTVQITANLDLFGHNSYIPLLIGLSMIAVGVLFFLLLRLFTRNKTEKRRSSDN
jgi:Trk-type K+ transport system membrane component